MSTLPAMTIQVFGLIEILVVAILFYLMPSLTRPSLFFGVTVDPAFRRSHAGNVTIRRYRMIVVAGTCLSLVETFSCLKPGNPARGWMPVVTVLAAGIIAYLDAHRRIVPHASVPDPQREAMLVPHRDRLPGGWAMQLSPFVLLAAAGVWLGTHWYGIPERFPVHWNLHGQPDGWATRSAWGVFGILIPGAGVCLLLLVASIGIVRWSRRVKAAGHRGVTEQTFRRLVLGSILVAELMVAALTSWIGISPVIRLGNPLIGAELIVAAGTIGLSIIIVLLIRIGQGGSKLAGDTEERPEGDRSEDHFWKAGLFYVNPSDPAIFVEKRFGIGYTLNFGNRWVWGTLLVLAAVVIIVLAVTALM